MTEQEVLNMAGRIARRYKDNNLYDDLRSEAIVAIYGEMSTNADAGYPRFWQVGMEAAWEYLNIRNKVVRIPVTSYSKAIARGRISEVIENKKVSKETAIEIYKALKIPTPTSTSMIYSVASQVEQATLKEKELVEDILAAAFDHLGSDDKTMFYMYYIEGMVMREIADLFSCSKQYVDQRLKASCELIKSQL